MPRNCLTFPDSMPLTGPLTVLMISGLWFISYFAGFIFSLVLVLVEPLDELFVAVCEQLVATRLTATTNNVNEARKCQGLLDKVLIFMTSTVADFSSNTEVRGWLGIS